MTFQFTHRLLEVFSLFSAKTAFFIQGQSYSYSELEKKIAQVQHHLLQQIPNDEKYIGLIGFDDIETYASIYALWFSGKAFVLISPKNPSIRNSQVVKAMNLKYLIHSRAIPRFALPQGSYTLINSAESSPSITTIKSISHSDEDDAYVLFTSGSTGIPKGVPISFLNLDGFIQGFMLSAGSYTCDDRFLQIYDLSFDASIPCYTIPLLVGASIYTVSPDEIKYLAAYRLIKEHRLTVIKMTPSTLHFLQPYFNSMRFDHVRYCMLGGEALSSKLASAWEKCVPNALIQNVYGPTEATVISLFYNWNIGDNPRKSYNNVVSIGKPYGNNAIAIVDENLKPVIGAEKGELCISGKQVMKGYWAGVDSSEDFFVNLTIDGISTKFYRTGDIVFMDADGDVFFCGRKDSQVQIQGYRVELGEIEKHARDFLGDINLLVLTQENTNGGMAIVLFAEGEMQSSTRLNDYLQSKLPYYMLPSRIIFMKEFPRLTSGKIDRKSLLYSL